MTRSILCALGVLFVSLSLYALGHPTSFLSSFMNFSHAWISIRMAIGFCLITYGLVDISRQTITRLLLGAAAIFALGLSLYSITSVYILAVDLFCLVSGGIFGLIGSVELHTSHKLKLHAPTIPSFSLPQVHLPHLNFRRRSVA